MDYILTRGDIQVILNYHTSKLIDPNGKFYYLERILEFHNYPEMFEKWKWIVGHFVSLAGAVEFENCRWLIIRDTYKKFGFNGYHLQPEEYVRQALLRGDGREGGVLLVVKSEEREEVVRDILSLGLKVSIGIMEARTLSRASKLGEKYVEVLKDLVRIRSVSGEEGKVGVGGVVDYIWELINDVGLQASFHEVKNSHNVVCEVGEGKKVVVIAAHVDTVSAESDGWLADPFSAEEGKVRHLGNSTVEIEVKGRRVRRKIRAQMDRVWQLRNEKERDRIR